MPSVDDLTMELATVLDEMSSVDFYRMNKIDERKKAEEVESRRIDPNVIDSIMGMTTFSNSKTETKGEAIRKAIEEIESFTDMRLYDPRLKSAEKVTVPSASEPDEAVSNKVFLDVNSKSEIKKHDMELGIGEKVGWPLLGHFLSTELSQPYHQFVSEPIRAIVDYLRHNASSVIIKYGDIHKSRIVIKSSDSAEDEESTSYCQRLIASIRGKKESSQEKKLQDSIENFQTSSEFIQTSSESPLNSKQSQTSPDVSQLSSKQSQTIPDVSQLSSKQSQTSPDVSQLSSKQHKTSSETFLISSGIKPDETNGMEDNDEQDITFKMRKKKKKKSKFWNMFGRKKSLTKTK